MVVFMIVILVISVLVITKKWDFFLMVKISPWRDAGWLNKRLDNECEKINFNYSDCSQQLRKSGFFYFV